jgi:hypothetical protein
MTAQTKTTLKTYFETGDAPTAAQFSDLIDTIPGTLGAIADGDVPSTIARDTEVSGAVSDHNSLATAHGLTANISAALSGAATPSAGNVFATMADAGAGGVQADEVNTWTAGQQFRTAQIFQKAALATGSFTAFSIDPQDAGARNWNFNVGVAANVGDAGRPDVVMNWGFNNLPDGGPEDATDDCYYEQMESYYAPGATSKVFEFHLNYYGPNRTPSFRPISISVNRHNDTTVNGPYYTEHGYIGDKFNWISRNGSFQMVILQAGATAALSQWIQYAPVVIRADGVAFSLQKADTTPVMYLGTTSPGLFFSDNAEISATVGGKALLFNTWALVQVPGVSFYPSIIDITQSAQSSKDFTFTANTKGPVLTDTADGHTYRIRSTNGALVLQQVS